MLYPVTVAFAFSEAQAVTSVSAAKSGFDRFDKWKIPAQFFFFLHEENINSCVVDKFHSYNFIILLEIPMLFTPWPCFTYIYICVYVCVRARLHWCTVHYLNDCPNTTKGEWLEADGKMFHM